MCDAAEGQAAERIAHVSRRTSAVCEQAKRDLVKLPLLKQHLNQLGKVISAAEVRLPTSRGMSSDLVSVSQHQRLLACYDVQCLAQRENSIVVSGKEDSMYLYYAQVATALEKAGETHSVCKDVYDHLETTSPSRHLNQLKPHRKARGVKLQQLPKEAIRTVVTRGGNGEPWCIEMLSMLEWRHKSQLCLSPRCYPRSGASKESD